MDVVEDPAQRALLAEALLGETEPPSVETVQGSITGLRLRRIESDLRDLRAQIAEAERRGDSTQLTALTQQKLELDRTLRQLQNHRPPK
jgi:DNA primase